MINYPRMIENILSTYIQNILSFLQLPNSFVVIHNSSQAADLYRLIRKRQFSFDKKNFNFINSVATCLTGKLPN